MAGALYGRILQRPRRAFCATWHGSRQAHPQSICVASAQSALWSLFARFPAGAGQMCMCEWGESMSLVFRLNKTVQSASLWMTGGHSHVSQVTRCCPISVSFGGKRDTEGTTSVLSASGALCALSKDATSAQTPTGPTHSDKHVGLGGPTRGFLVPLLDRPLHRHFGVRK